MKDFTNEEIAEYYDRTEVHYRSAWDLSNSLAMHYGFWKKETASFRESLLEMNHQMAKFGEIQAHHRVLDAGCGVGGSSIFLAKKLGCKVTGITLSDKQAATSNQNAAKRGVSNLVNFEQADFTNTPFPDNHFDVIWGLESVVHANDKGAFFKEAHRILKKGGCIILGDYYKKEGQFLEKEEGILQKWLNAWAIADICSVSEMTNLAVENGLQAAEFRNITDNIKKTASRMYYSSFYLGAVSAMYRIYNPKVSFFADNHYKAMRNQYPALKKGLWGYYFAKFVK